jgi:aspartyl/glutamyl-tRNA(Asn/Gln) amidotransferase C subunit
MTPAEVRRLGALARLRPDPAEVRSLAAQLSAILHPLQALGAADEADAAGGFDPGTDTPLRADEPGPDPLHAPPARIAPMWADGFFIVPRGAGEPEGTRGSDGAG